jgi:hypothetical protein
MSSTGILQGSARVCPICGNWFGVDIDKTPIPDVCPGCSDPRVKFDAVNHPKHYTKHPSGVECIQITEHMNFCKGNAVKYIWRAGEKSNEIEDLEKARWYLDREIARLKKPKT